MIPGMETGEDKKNDDDRSGSGADDDKSRDMLDDWKKLNQNPPSVKDGPLPPKKDSGK